MYGTWGVIAIVIAIGCALAFAIQIISLPYCI